MVVIAIVAWAAVRGAKKGFLHQASWIVALVVCAVFGRQCCAQYADRIHAPAPLNEWICVTLLYLAASLVCFAAVRVLRAIIERVKMDEYDRHLGSILGILKGVLVCMILVAVLAVASETTDRAVRPSMSRRATVVIMDRLMPALSDKLIRLVSPLVDELRHDPSPPASMDRAEGVWPSESSTEPDSEDRRPGRG